jgi:hypothetical protein
MVQSTPQTRLTSEAKLRILYRILKGVGQIVPVIKEVVIVAETAVGVADDYEKGLVVCSSPNPSLSKQPLNISSEIRPDLSLDVLWQVLQFEHISFRPEVFRSLLQESGIIQLPDCLIVPSSNDIAIHIDTLPRLKGRYQFSGAILTARTTGAILTTPGAMITDTSGQPVHRLNIAYDRPSSLKVGKTWTIDTRPGASLPRSVCSQISVDPWRCEVISFSLFPEGSGPEANPSREFSICIVR